MRRDYLWETFEQMSAELECSVDYLVNEAMRQYARSRNYGGRAEPTGQTATPGREHAGHALAVDAGCDAGPGASARADAGPRPTADSEPAADSVGASGPAGALAIPRRPRTVLPRRARRAILRLRRDRRRVDSLRRRPMARRRNNSKRRLSRAERIWRAATEQRRLQCAPGVRRRIHFR